MAHFKYIQRLDVKEKEFLNFLSQEISSLTNYPCDTDKGETPEQCYWSVHSEVLEGDYIKELVLKREIIPETTSKEIYVKLTNLGVTDVKKHATIIMQLLDEYDKDTQEFKVKGAKVKYQFADESVSYTERTANNALHVFMNIDNDRIAMVVQADPVVNFNDYRKSFMYIGKTETFEYNQDDIEGNVLLTAGAVEKEPSLSALKGTDDYFGVYTSVGNNSFQMLATKSGVKFQSHYPAFTTPAPIPGSAYVHSQIGDTGLELEKQGFQASRHTGKYHVSPIYVVHPYEGYRSMLKDCIAVINHNILHLDKLVVDVDKCKYPEKTWKQEVYRFFDINTEQVFFNRSANRGTAIAILSELRY